MSSQVDLSGQVALITGGASGIGHSIAQELSDRGVKCALAGRREGPLVDAVTGLSTPGLAVSVDITAKDGPESAVASVGEALGPIDTLVHSAGIFLRDPITETTDSMWADTIAVNLTAVMRLSRSAWPDLVDTRGQILMLSSIAVNEFFPDNSAYAASKGGLNSLAGVLAEEGRQVGIRVITLMPGQTATPIWRGEASESVLERMMSPHAIGDLAVNLLASDRGLDFEPITVRPPFSPWG